ncbi:unnamed protein product [Cuscuta europaea]|uniref:Uncharacterized protein n=1 Tax=Cuscuta europaea TaxID=41803 RepID=A0A9P1EB14_CUSEU|nr:unnamed protein product [Cuscuta europaea]
MVWPTEGTGAPSVAAKEEKREIKERSWKKIDFTPAALGRSVRAVLGNKKQHRHGINSNSATSDRGHLLAGRKETQHTYENHMEPDCGTAGAREPERLRRRGRRAARRRRGWRNHGDTAWLVGGGRGSATFLLFLTESADYSWVGKKFVLGKWGKLFSLRRFFGMGWGKFFWGGLGINFGMGWE